MNAGKQFLSNQGGGNEQGQQQQQGGSGGGGGFDIGDIAGLVNHAQSHDQTNSGDNQLFGQGTFERQRLPVRVLLCSPSYSFVPTFPTSSGQLLAK